MCGSDNNPDLYSGGTLFKSRPEYQVTSLNFLDVPQCLEKNARIVPRSGHNSFFPNSISFRRWHSVQPFDVV
jgi:hypothetical protein